MSDPTWARALDARVWSREGSGCGSRRGVFTRVLTKSNMCSMMESEVLTMNRSVHTAPLPQSAVDLLARADAELLAAQFSSEPGERFVHAHLAALRAAAAVIAVRGRPLGRRAPRAAWEMLAVVAPELEAWSAYFASGAALRRAVEAGRLDAVDAARAESVLCSAEDFLDEVGELLSEAALATAALKAAARTPAARTAPARATAARTVPARVASPRASSTTGARLSRPERLTRQAS